MPSIVGDLNSLLSTKWRLEVSAAVRLVIHCCDALTGNVLEYPLTPGRITVSSELDVHIGDYVPSASDIGYIAPEFSVGLGSSTPAPTTGSRGHWHLPSTQALQIDMGRAAVFTLGVVLWELLAERRLFVGATDYESLLRVQDAQVPNLPGLPQQLDAIVRKALSKSIEFRFQTVSEFRNALAAYLEPREADGVV